AVLLSDRRHATAFGRTALSLLLRPLAPCPPLFPYTTLFRSWRSATSRYSSTPCRCSGWGWSCCSSSRSGCVEDEQQDQPQPEHRSEEHTSELQSRSDLVCRLLLEKKNMHVAQVNGAHHAEAA